MNRLKISYWNRLKKEMWKNVLWGSDYHFRRRIHPIPKWRLIYYSFICMSSSPLSPSLKILLYFAHADEAKRANLHGYKIKKKWLPFWTKVHKSTKTCLICHFAVWNITIASFWLFLKKITHALFFAWAQFPPLTRVWFFFQEKSSGNRAYIWPGIEEIWSEEKLGL